MKVFISHKTGDPHFDELRAAIESCLPDVQCWDPGGIAAGATLQEALSDAIGACSICVFIATKASLISGWCQAELGAFWGLQRPVLVYLPNGDLTDADLPVQFRHQLWAGTIDKVIKSIRDQLVSDRLSFPIVSDLSSPVERMRFFTTIHRRSRNLFCVSMGYDIDDAIYYSRGETKMFLDTVRELMRDPERRYERYQIVTGAAHSWLRFLLREDRDALGGGWRWNQTGNMNICYLNIPADTAMYRARMLQVFISEHLDHTLGKTAYLVTSIETGADRPYGLEVRHSGFANAFEAQLRSYYRDAHRQYGITREQLHKELDADPEELRTRIDDCTKSFLDAGYDIAEDEAVTMIVRQLNTLNHGLIRESYRRQRAARTSSSVANP
jgi:hypothetical protein